MSHENIFQILAQSVEAIQSYWSVSAGYRNWVLMVVRANDLKCLMSLCYKSQLNPLRQSKVIGPPVHGTKIGY